MGLKIYSYSTIMDPLDMELPAMENEFVDAASELATGDKFLNLSILESYLEKHPEDLFKWGDHLKESLERGPMDRRDITDDIVNAHIIQQDAQAPTNDEPCCEVCKKTFASTEANPTMTLLCKHKCHTVCYFIHQNNYDKCCPNAGCDINMWRIARKIDEKNVNAKKEVRNMFIEKYKKNPKFKKDLGELKECIKQVSVYRRKLLALINDEKKALLEKHAYALQAIQNDLNKIQRGEKDTPEYAACKLWANKYRRLIRRFERYNLTFYELKRYRLINVRRNVVRMLDNNNHVFSRYYKRIFLMPGSKKWF